MPTLSRHLSLAAIDATPGPLRGHVNPLTGLLLAMLLSACSPSERGTPEPGAVTIDRQELKVVAPRGTDFSGDRRADVVLLRSNGEVLLWDMNGGTVVAQTSLGGVGPDWKVADASGDYDGDGRSDILWRHTSGAVALWLMDGHRRKASANLGVVPADWKIADGRGDYDGDGRSDILWRNTAGTVAIWRMEGARVAGTFFPATVPAEWTIVDGSGDYDGDGRSDILWRSAAGPLAIWRMQGAAIASASFLPGVGTEWTLADGTGDYNGDGRSDLLWRHAAGPTVVWYMANGGVAATATIGSATSEWRIVDGSGDYDGDGRSDVLWQNTSGQVYLWRIEGARLAGVHDVGRLGSDWQVAAGSGAAAPGPAVGVGAPGSTRPPTTIVTIGGQDASFTVVATGANLAYRWQTRSISPEWIPVPSATQPTLTVPRVGVASHNHEYRAVVSNASGSVASDVAVLQVTWGQVDTGYNGNIDSYDAPGGGNGGDGPGDGGGGGGMGKVLGGLLTVNRVADGSMVGQARTDADPRGRGLVRIRTAPGVGPLLVTLEGLAGTQYFDEAMNRMLPFPAGRTMHALVDRFDEHLGVTPFTEAAFRYAINQFVADPVAIRQGRAPLQRNGPVTTLTVEQIRQANRVVLDEVNRHLPAGYRLLSLKSLPTPIDASSSLNAVGDSRYGRMQAVTGGLVIAAAQFDPTLGSPAFAALEDLARDLTDGRIDGFALDGTPSAQVALGSYDSTRFASALLTGSNAHSVRVSQDNLYRVAPQIAMTSNAESHGNGACMASAGDFRTWLDDFALFKDGSIQVLRWFIGANCRLGSPVLLRDFATGVKRIESSAAGPGYLVTQSGDVRAWGSAACGLLGNGTETGRADTPVTVGPVMPSGRRLAEITQISSAFGAVIARDAQGRVYTWGANAGGALGQGPGATFDGVCDKNDLLGFLPGVQIDSVNRYPRQVAGLRDIVSVFANAVFAMYAVDKSGAVWGWGENLTYLNLPGLPRNAQNPTPQRIAGLTEVREMATGGDVTFALRRDGSVVGWGRNETGVFGDGSKTPKEAALRVPNLPTNIVSIAGDGFCSMYALAADGRLYHWYGERSPRRPDGYLQGAACPEVQTLRQPAEIAWSRLRFTVPPRVRQLSSNLHYIYLYLDDGGVLKLPGYWPAFPTFGPSEITGSFLENGGGVSGGGALSVR